jgi:hypothetical protein
MAADLDNWAAIEDESSNASSQTDGVGHGEGGLFDKKVQDGGREEKLSFGRCFLICMYSIIDGAVHCASTSLDISRCPMEFTKQSTNCARPAVVRLDTSE